MFIDPTVLIKAIVAVRDQQALVKRNKNECTLLVADLERMSAILPQGLGSNTLINDKNPAYLGVVLALDGCKNVADVALKYVEACSHKSSFSLFGKADKINIDLNDLNKKLQLNLTLLTTALGNYNSALIEAGEQERKKADELRAAEAKRIEAAQKETRTEIKSNHVEMLSAVKQIQLEQGDYTVSMFDYTSSILRHAGMVRAIVQISPDMIASAGSDHTIKLWNSNGKGSAKTIQAHNGFIDTLATHNGLLISASYNEIKIWDIEKRKVKTLLGHKDNVNVLATWPDKELFVSGSEDQTIKVWDISSGRLIRTIGEHGSAVDRLLALRNGTLLSCTFKGAVTIWNVETGTPIKTLPKVTLACDMVELSNGNIAISDIRKYAEDIYFIDVYNPSTAQLVKSFEVSGITFNLTALKDGGLAVSRGEHKHDIQIYDIETGTLRQTLEPQEDEISAVLETDKGLLIAGDGKGKMTLRDINQYKILRTIGPEPVTLKGASSVGKLLTTSAPTINNTATQQTGSPANTQETLINPSPAPKQQRDLSQFLF